MNNLLLLILILSISIAITVSQNNFHFCSSAFTLMVHFVFPALTQEQGHASHDTGDQHAFASTKKIGSRNRFCATHC